VCVPGRRRCRDRSVMTGWCRECSSCAFQPRQRRVGPVWKPLSARPSGARCAPRCAPRSLASLVRCGAYVARDGSSGQPLPFPPGIVRSTERPHRASTVRSDSGTSNRAGLKGAAGSAGPGRRKHRSDRRERGAQRGPAPRARGGFQQLPVGAVSSKLTKPIQYLRTTNLLALPEHGRPVDLPDGPHMNPMSRGGKDSNKL